MVYERQLVVYTETMESLKEFFESFNITFDVDIGKEDGLAEFVARSGQNVLKICPEHRKAARPTLTETQGTWRALMWCPMQ